ncbi:MAG: hypothetical protein Q8P10_03560, partial [bacterium]|nr:hypothetical protein [bacterium]
MIPSDISAILAWWAMFFSIGIVFLALTDSIFSNFFDKGYIFSKIIGFLFISYFVFILGILKLSAFSRIEILLSIVIFAGINLLILLRKN